MSFDAVFLSRLQFFWVVALHILLPAFVGLASYIAVLSPVPVITLGLFAWLLRSLHSKREAAPFLAALGLFAMCYLGLGISIVPMIVPYTVTLWAAASAAKSQAFMVIGTLFLLPIIVMYTGWSYWVFRGKVEAGSGYH